MWTRLYSHHLLDAISHPRATYGVVDRPILLDEVGCAGTESNLLDCPHTSQHDCSQFENAGVECNRTGELHTHTHTCACRYTPCAHTHTHKHTPCTPCAHRHAHTTTPSVRNVNWSQCVVVKAIRSYYSCIAMISSVTKYIRWRCILCTCTQYITHMHKLCIINYIHLFL